MIELKIDSKQETIIPSPASAEGQDGGLAKLARAKLCPHLNPPPRRGRRSEIAGCGSISLIMVFLVWLSALSHCISVVHAADRIRFAYPAKSLNYLPITLGRDKGIFQTEGIDLQMILVASTIQVAALPRGIHVEIKVLAILAD